MMLLLNAFASASNYLSLARFGSVVARDEALQRFFGNRKVLFARIFLAACCDKLAVSFKC